MTRILLSILLTIAAVQPIAAQQGGELYSDLRTTKTPLIEAPKPKPTHTTRNVFIANAIMFGASVVEANAVAYGSQQCWNEAARHHISIPNFYANYGGQIHPYKHDFKITIPLDIGITALSLLLHKKHHDTLAVLFPVSSASAQISAAGLKYGAGCF